MRIIRRAFAADRWPWTWSVILLGWGLTPPAALLAPWAIAAGVLAAAVAVEVVDRGRRDRLALAGVSAIVAGVVPLIGLSWRLAPLAVALVIVARVVGDRYPAVPQRTPRTERIAARRARIDARHAAADAAEVWR